LDISGPKIRAASSLREKGFGRRFDKLKAPSPPRGKKAPFRQAQGPELVEGQKAQKKTAKYEFSFLRLLRLFAAIPHLRTAPQWP